MLGGDGFLVPRRRAEHAQQLLASQRGVELDGAVEQQQRARLDGGELCTRRQVAATAGAGARGGGESTAKTPKWPRVAARTRTRSWSPGCTGSVGEQRLDAGPGPSAPHEDVHGQVALDARVDRETSPAATSASGRRMIAKTAAATAHAATPPPPTIAAVRTVACGFAAGHPCPDDRRQRRESRIVADLRRIGEQRAVPVRAGDARHQVGAQRRLGRWIQLAREQLVQAQIGQVRAVVHDATSRVRPSAACARV